MTAEQKTCATCGQEKRAVTSRTPEGAWKCGCGSDERKAREIVDQTFGDIKAEWAAGYNEESAIDKVLRRRLPHLITAALAEARREERQASEFMRRELKSALLTATRQIQKYQREAIGVQRTRLDTLVTGLIRVAQKYSRETDLLRTLARSGKEQSE
jgi:hypothetical protein